MNNENQIYELSIKIHSFKPNTQRTNYYRILFYFFTTKSNHTSINTQQGIYQKETRIFLFCIVQKKHPF